MAGVTKVEDITVTAREVDFVTRFGRNWKALQDILGITRPIKKTPGTTLRSYAASVTLEDGDVAEGAVIPYSKATVTEAYKEDLTIEKYAKAVTIEAVNKYGAAVAVEKTDDAFLTQLQNKVMNRFYTFLQTGALTGAEATFQMAIAMAIGKIKNKFETMDKDITDIAVFVNTLDAYQYLGAADLTVQNQFGMDYIENFLGAKKMFLSSKIPAGEVIATPVENIDLYYVDPGDSNFAKLGLNYTVEGETNLIGFHANGNYSTAVGESFALMGMTLWAEYLDGIAVISVGTETFTAVENPSGNPAALMYYEKDASNNYFRTTDTTVVSGKTYYTRTVTNAGA